jgi:hypothetical protein
MYLNGTGMGREQPELLSVELNIDGFLEYQRQRERA